MQEDSRDDIKSYLYRDISWTGNITQQFTKKYIDVLNSRRKNRSKDTAATQTR